MPRPFGPLASNSIAAMPSVSLALPVTVELHSIAPPGPASRSSTRALRVTTYGLPSYAANQINDQLLLAQPAVVNRFTVSAEKPALQLRRLATGFRVVWPKSEEGYRLERTVNLGASANWSPVDSTVVGDENSAAVIDEAAAFYRLRKP